MIIYKDILKRLADSGYSTYRIRKEKLIGTATVTKLRTGGTITTETLDTICRLCSCQPGDLIEYKKDSE